MWTRGPAGSQIASLSEAEKQIRKTVVLAVLALIVGVFAARWYYTPKVEVVDPINVMVTQMRTHAVIDVRVGEL